MTLWARPLRAVLLGVLALTLGACQTAPRRTEVDSGRANEPPGAQRSPVSTKRTAKRPETSTTTISSPPAPAEANVDEAGSTHSGLPDAARSPPEIEVENAPPPEADLWARLRANFSFVECEPRKSMRASLRGFTAHPEAFERMLDNAAPQLDYVTRRLAEADIPAEFALLPMVESRYVIFPKRAGSRGPAGPWQLMPRTARAFGLKVDRNHDERLELVASTAAAIRLLKSLHNQFDDWVLVNLAFNAGDGRVRGALRRAGGWHGDPYALPLSPITRAHFSRLRALVCICTEPERYGLSLPAPPTTQLHALSASQDRNEAEGSEQTIQPPTIPATHVVARGESLWRVAQRYSVALDKLRHWNALGTKSLLQPGQILRLTAP